MSGFHTSSSLSEGSAARRRLQCHVSFEGEDCNWVIISSLIQNLTRAWRSSLGVYMTVDIIIQLSSGNWRLVAGM